MYEVREWCMCGGWTNHWTTTDDEGKIIPMVFDTEEEAWAELEEYMQDMADAVEDGDMEDAPAWDDFRIEAVE